jgi:hypothetical protein
LYPLTIFFCWFHSCCLPMNSTFICSPSAGAPNRSYFIFKAFVNPRWQSGKTLLCSFFSIHHSLQPFIHFLSKLNNYLPVFKCHISLGNKRVGSWRYSSFSNKKVSLLKQKSFWPEPKCFLLGSKIISLHSKLVPLQLICFSLKPKTFPFRSKSASLYPKTIYIGLDSYDLSNIHFGSSRIYSHFRHIHFDSS